MERPLGVNKNKSADWLQFSAFLIKNIQFKGGQNAIEFDREDRKGQ
jgi:hypothetical protein